MGLFKQIDINKVKEMIDTRDVVIADIRDRDAFNAGHIKSAVFVNDKNVEEFLKTTDREKTLICYCYHGISSQSAAEYFAQNGFKEVYSIEGGFEKWKGVYSFVSSP